MFVFESSADDVLGLWSTAPEVGAVSFGIEGDSAQPGGEVYRTHLPADLEAAQKVFSAGESNFLRMNAALDGIPTRLDSLVERTQDQRQKQTSGVSFGAQSFEQESGLDGQLLAQLAYVDRGGVGELSFGIGDRTSDAWDAAKTQFTALITQIDRDVLHFAWVETDISDQLVARTAVDWSGDMQTVWNDGISFEQARLHECTLKTVTLTRNLRLRLFVTVASGSVKMASLMAVPGGVVLALPAVYQYVIKILAQVREIQSIQTP